jgi:hypothetical protein
MRAPVPRGVNSAKSRFQQQVVAVEIANFIIGVAALVIGAVATIIAVPPFLQMIYGRPKILVRFDESVEQGANLLICNIYNRPITNWFLKKIGVARNATDVFASFNVRELGTNEILANAFRASLFDGKANMSGLSLASKPSLPIVFVVVEHNDSGAITINHAPSQSKKLVLKPGEHLADVKIAWGEYAVSAVSQSFTIDTDKFSTHWTARKIAEQW